MEERTTQVQDSAPINIREMGSVFETTKLNISPKIFQKFVELIACYVAAFYQVRVSPT